MPAEVVISEQNRTGEKAAPGYIVLVIYATRCLPKVSNVCFGESVTLLSSRVEEHGKI